jgi:[protein-PII] uridylyltransferase
VVDAGVVTMQDHYVLDTFHVLETDGQPVTGDQRMNEIQSTLRHAINGDTEHSWHVSRRLPRTHRHFPIKTHITFKQDVDDQRTVMELITADRPGLLSRVGRAFADCDTRLWNAKIATLGSRAEDFYYITDLDNSPLNEQQLECLEKSVKKYLELDEKQ